MPIASVTPSCRLRRSTSRHWSDTRYHVEVPAFSVADWVLFSTSMPHTVTNTFSASIGASVSRIRTRAPLASELIGVIHDVSSGESTASSWLTEFS